MVGASTDKGSLAFWDVVAAKEIQKFSEHKAPSTGLAFSPVNEVLGGFQLLYLIVTELKSHMTYYKSMPLIGWNYSIQTGELIL